MASQAGGSCLALFLLKNAPFPVQFLFDHMHESVGSRVVDITQ